MPLLKRVWKLTSDDRRDKNAMFADGCVKDMMNQFPLLCNPTFVSSSL